MKKFPTQARRLVSRGFETRLDLGGNGLQSRTSWSKRGIDHSFFDIFFDGNVACAVLDTKQDFCEFDECGRNVSWTQTCRTKRELLR